MDDERRGPEDERIRPRADFTTFFEAEWSEEGSRIGIVDADGTDVQLLTDGSERVCCPAWQPVPVQQEAPQPTSSPSPIAVDARVAGLVRLEGIPGSVAAAESSVWVATYDYDDQQAAIAHVDAITNKVVATVPVDGVVYNLAADTNAVWVPAGAQPSVALLRIDATTNEVTGRVEGVHGPVVVDPTGCGLLRTARTSVTRPWCGSIPRPSRSTCGCPWGSLPSTWWRGAGRFGSWAARHAAATWKRATFIRSLWGHRGEGLFRPSS